KWAELLENKVVKLDSISSGLKLKSRERKNLINILPVLEYWKTEVANFKASFNSEYPPELLKTRKVLKSEFDRLKNGLDERKQVIFYQEHKNHGNVDNGIRSWEK
ncbi:MAG: hypothetical protein KAR38_14645, partial [Calditrichia bacterium]|nr:hypothetical protein [Calditrichia bacterium]